MLLVQMESPLQMILETVSPEISIPDEGVAHPLEDETPIQSSTAISKQTMNSTIKDSNTLYGRPEIRPEQK